MRGYSAYAWLADEIILQAAKDYKSALQTLSKASTGKRRTKSEEKILR